MPVESASVADRLLHYYDCHARRLPWRAPPGTNATDPYRVWLSEVMLQQTTVAAVIPYFEAFTARWPTVADLAAADDAALMSAWAGLGYYARARNLLACARVVARERGGRFPSSEAELRGLPGVGAYTAAAIAAIAFGARAVVVDANVERVVARLFAIATPLPAARAEIRQRTDAITPEARAGDFAQAMMDLGATICTVRNPACGICPLRETCAAFATADPTAFPLKAAKKARPQRSGDVWWIVRDDAVWLERRPAKGLLGGMRGLPTSAWIADASPTPKPTTSIQVPIGAPIGGQWDRLPMPVTHVFTHFALSLTVHIGTADSDCTMPGDGEWWPLAAIGDAGLPTLFAKVADAVMNREDALCRRLPQP
ncbi:A/G-specific adenine glycosylase [Sphingobium algorifonticola]|uniref:Adenine DNA glycosylase n=1 Tax=Sphingobium algorifonticola TaxID=2008318 RepID=A0A437JC52_9SPHN|nr:A/G-specific adenine glycosylase [Sphingobium algorifonticola]RVT43498.1 A/G-specific adenine glycosylase [Sphingobium algorifonticola]